MVAVDPSNIMCVLHPESLVSMEFTKFKQIGCPFPALCEKRGQVINGTFQSSKKFRIFLKWTLVEKVDPMIEAPVHHKINAQCLSQ